MTIYFLTGLGADKRAFSKIKLPDVYSIKHVEWITPLKNETLSEYAKRLLPQIDTSLPFILVGLSMGGMLAVEIARLTNPKLVILISSIKGSDELPWYYKLVGIFKLHKLLPATAIKTPKAAGFYFIGTRDRESRKIITQMSNSANPVFVKWAVNAIVNWKSKEHPKNVFHIHGTDDHILPIRFTKPDVRLEGGGHMLVYTMANQVSGLIQNKLENI